MSGLPAAVDVLIVGSGPCGATVARLVLDRVPTASVLIADAGPCLVGRPGVNVRNLDVAERTESEARCNAVEPGPRSRPVQSGEVIEARPGTHLLIPMGHAHADDVPGAAYSSNLGGMAAHWTCVTPRPEGSERIPFVPRSEMDEALATAERLLAVTADGYQPTPRARSVRRRLEKSLGHLVTGDRPIQPMPLAGSARKDGQQPVWAGVDTILRGGPQPQVATDMLCRRILISDRRVTGARFDDRRSDGHHTVRCRVMVVAAGAFHTPQLLWASGIRPAALGRYLNVHPQVVAAVSTGASPAPIERPPGDDRAHLSAVYWVPFNDRAHPWHGQILVAEPPGRDSAIVSLAWYVPKALDARCRIDLADDRLDHRGLPAPSVIHEIAATDRRMTDQALSIVAETAAALGQYLSNGEPRVLVSGKSLHYQGTTRMGPRDDGKSVCDTTGHIWGVDGLYVAGPGVIPTATACNPTLTAVALASIAADNIAKALLDP